MTNRKGKGAQNSLEELEYTDLDANEQAFFELSQEASDDHESIIEINRDDVRTAKRRFVRNVPLADYVPLNKLKDLLVELEQDDPQRGGSTYKMRVRYHGRIRKHLTLMIAEQKKKEPVIAQPGAAAQSELARIIQEGQAENRELIKTLLADRNDKGSRMDELKEMFMLMKLGREAFGGGGGGGGGSGIDDLLKMRKLLKSLEGGGEDTGDGLMEKFFALVGEVAPQLLDKFGPREPMILDAEFEEVPNAAASAAPKPAAQRETPQAKAGPMNLVTMYLRKYEPEIRTLLRAAKAGKDPAPYALMMLDLVPEELPPEKVLEYLRRPDALDLLQKYIPATKPLVTWFSELQQSAIEFLTQRADTDGSGAGEGEELDSGADLD